MAVIFSPELRVVVFFRVWCLCFFFPVVCVSFSDCGVSLFLCFFFYGLSPAVVCEVSFV
jgi:hypothetical protein